MALRHNWLRDTIAKLLSSAKCKDVKIEPQLLPTNGKNLSSGSITADQARLDISARSAWNVCERAFFDVQGFLITSLPQIQTNNLAKCIQLMKHRINGHTMIGLFR